MLCPAAAALLLLVSLPVSLAAPGANSTATTCPLCLQVLTTSQPHNLLTNLTPGEDQHQPAECLPLVVQQRWNKVNTFVSEPIWITPV